MDGYARLCSPGPTRDLISLPLAGLLGALYAVLIATNIFGAAGGFGSLGDVGRLFENPYLLLAGWVHYLAFDLFVGAWGVRDARRLQINHPIVVP